MTDRTKEMKMIEKMFSGYDEEVEKFGNHMVGYGMDFDGNIAGDLRVTDYEITIRLFPGVYKDTDMIIEAKDE